MPTKKEREIASAKEFYERTLQKTTEKPSATTAAPPKRKRAASSKNTPSKPSRKKNPPKTDDDSTVAKRPTKRRKSTETAKSKKAEAFAHAKKWSEEQAAKEADKQAAALKKKTNSTDSRRSARRNEMDDEEIEPSPPKKSEETESENEEDDDSQAAIAPMRRAEDPSDEDDDHDDSLTIETIDSPPKAEQPRRYPVAPSGNIYHVNQGMERNPHHHGNRPAAEPVQQYGRPANPPVHYVHPANRNAVDPQEPQYARPANELRRRIHERTEPAGYPQGRYVQQPPVDPPVEIKNEEDIPIMNDPSPVVNQVEEGVDTRPPQASRFTWSQIILGVCLLLGIALAGYYSTTITSARSVPKIPCFEDNMFDTENGLVHSDIPPHCKNVAVRIPCPGTCANGRLVACGRRFAEGGGPDDSIRK